ncbi:MAG: hypothetical protein ACR2OX_11910 [Methyloligellaceae bacterium]
MQSILHELRKRKYVLQISRQMRRWCMQNAYFSSFVIARVLSPNVGELKNKSGATIADAKAIADNFENTLASQGSNYCF